MVELQRVKEVPQGGVFGGGQLSPRTIQVMETAKKLKKGEFIRIPVTEAYPLEEQKKEKIRWWAAVKAASKQLGPEFELKVYLRGKDVYFERL